MYKGEAEYSTIRQIKAAILIPVIANGDITSPEKAQSAELHQQMRNDSRGA